MTVVIKESPFVLSVTYFLRIHSNEIQCLNGYIEGSLDSHYVRHTSRPADEVVSPDLPAIALDQQDIIPHHWPGLHPRNSRAFVCLSSKIWLKKPVGGVAVAAYLHNDEIPLIHLYHLSVVMGMLWRSDAGGTSICTLESWWIIIKNIVFSFFQPGTMIEWGNYW